MPDLLRQYLMQSGAQPRDLIAGGLAGGAAGEGMLDIVEWLRKEAALIDLPRLEEAAAAIARLRANNAELLAALKPFAANIDAVYAARAAIAQVEGTK